MQSSEAKNLKKSKEQSVLQTYFFKIKHYILNKNFFKPDKQELLNLLYRTTYIVGIQTIRILKRIRKRIRKFFLPVTNLFKAFYHRTIGKQILRLITEIQSIQEGFCIAKYRLKEAKKQGIWQAIVESLKVAHKSIVRHKGFLLSIMNLVAPISSTLILIFTIHYWNTQNFGLILTYDGQDSATIQNETVFEQATEMVNQRMVHDTANEEATVNIAPKFRLSVVDKSKYSSTGAICDLLIKRSNGIIEEASGLYVDGELLGVIKSGVDLRYILQSFLNAARGNDTKIEAEFSQNVETVTGLFPTTSIMTTQNMKELLSGTSKDAQVYTVKEGDTATSIAQAHNMSLATLNRINGNQIGDMLHEDDLINLEVAVPRLSVQLVRTQNYQLPLAYKTITEKDDSKFTDYSKVKTNGSNGLQQCIDKVTYLNGAEVKRERVNTTTVKQAVDKVIVIGTKKRTQSNSLGISSGSLMWPVPALHTITTYFQYRWGSFHAAIDISGSSAFGKTIVAADGGTVVLSGFSGSYGYCIKINHGGGTQTLYAHCSKLLVHSGQKVSKGQAIALVGSTGNSTGPHVHFEVYKGGVRVNPLKYVSR